MSEAAEPITPSWSQLHALGRSISPHMDHYATLEEVAAELGTTKQMAYHESMVALGKLALLLRGRLQLPVVPVARVRINRARKA